MRIVCVVIAVVAACSSSHSGSSSDAPGSPGDGRGSNLGDGSNGNNPDAPPGSYPRTIFVIPMENESSMAIYANKTYAPYIQTLLPMGAHATMFGDELPTLPSEPHYVWMEAGTNVFTDASFTNDNDPTSTHSTNSTEHLATQMEAAHVTWMSYQEDLNSTTGACPIASSGFYAAKHDPFVFFQDVVGATPSKTAPLCMAHHKPYSQFEADLMAGPMPQFVWITPNLCHDMHGASGCPAGTNVNQDIAAGDTWLSTELPRILAYANAHDGIVFITWDEGDSTNLIPFIALGPRVKVNYTATMTYNHSSMLKSTEEVLGISPLSKVANATDLADLFQAGMFP